MADQRKGNAGQASGHESSQRPERRARHAAASRQTDSASGEAVDINPDAGAVLDDRAGVEIQASGKGNAEKRPSEAPGTHKPGSAGDGKAPVHHAGPAGDGNKSARKPRSAVPDEAAVSGSRAKSKEHAQHSKSAKPAEPSDGRQGSGKKSTKKRKRSKNILNSSFYRVYFVALAVCLVGIVALMVWLHGVLTDYEAAQPVYVAEETVKLFEDGDYASLYDYDTTAASADSREQYVQRMNELTWGGEITWTQGYTSEDDVRVYDVRLDGERLARLSLVPTDRTTAHGNRFWTLDSVTTFVDMHDPTPGPSPEQTPDPAAEPTPEPYAGFMERITVPSGYHVSVNGTELTQAEATRTDIPAVPVGMLPDNIPNPTLTEYEFYSELETPSFEVTDTNGTSREVHEDSTHIWSCGLPEDEQMKQQLSGSVASLAGGIARCAARTLRKGSLLPYCINDSPAYKTIDAFDDATGMTGRRYKFENVVISDFYRYTDEFFSCHVSFDYLNYYDNEHVKRDATSITLYFAYRNNTGKLYSFTMY